ncbi:MAG: glycogen synthase GlgA [Deltaproteobacteria bacterium]
MRVLMIGSEVSPFGQTGGLGEVLSALPAELVALGMEVDVLMPKYRGITADHYDLELLEDAVEVDLNAEKVIARFWKFHDKRGVRYLFLENDAYYDREGLYGTKFKDYEDNLERFVFLTRASIEMALSKKIRYDIYHAHDWQAALTPVYLRTLFAGEELLEKSASVMTIHNLGFQGIFTQQDLPVVGVAWEFFNPAQMEFHGQLNFLKSGIVFADEVNTVSVGYRDEILTPELGFGLDGALQSKREHLTGILNGVDYRVWNPADDPKLAANYDADNLEGKAVCKEDLQRIAEVPLRPDVPLLCMVSRLSSQKGLDILEKAVPMLLDQDVQFVLLGTGEPRYQDVFLEVGSRYKEKTGIFLSYNQELAHKIFAGADMILVPSRYEPCGLNQLYALKYGTVPIVRSTGGLNDTVEQFDPENDTGTGFKFAEPDSELLERTVWEAVDLYTTNRDAWRRLMLRGMKQDFSWTRSAKEYQRLYEKALHTRKKLLAPNCAW